MAARQTLATALLPLGITNLTLSSILCASVPPGFSRDAGAQLLAVTNAFLDAIDATRRAVLGLLPLDAG